MQLNEVRTKDAEPTFSHPLLGKVSADRLRQTVDALDYPRQYVVQPEGNRRARDWICGELTALGFYVELHGQYDNVLAFGPHAKRDEPLVLLGSHYDTVETTPGADDNSSAIAVSLEAARVLAEQSVPLVVASFNREEDGLLGSRDFVKNGIPELHLQISEAHIFEMVGYFTSEPKSQTVPEGLPIKLPAVGDFLGVLSNQKSNSITKRLEQTASQLCLATPLVTLKTYLGIEKLVSDLLRSDHASFWQAGIPALMWTDTSNFRNANYHAPTDTPDTLNYEAMADVTRLIVGDLLRKFGV